MVLVLVPLAAVCCLEARVRRLFLRARAVAAAQGVAGGGLPPRRAHAL
jgi:hypothetical protein